MIVQFSAKPAFLRDPSVPINGMAFKMSLSVITPWTNLSSNIKLVTEFRNILTA